MSITEADNPSKPKLSLAEAAQANLRTGILLLCKEALVTAIQDRRLERSHLRVLAAIATFMSNTTAKAWPSRASVSSVTGLSLKTVSNTMHELRSFGYLICDRETIEEAGNRRLTVYTFGNIDHETIRREICAWVERARNAREPEKKVPAYGEHSSPPAGNFPAEGEVQVPAPRGTSPPTGNSETPEFPARGAESSPPAGRRNSSKELLKKRDDFASKSFWVQALNGTTDRDIQLQDGKLELLNELKAEWFNRLGGEDRLALALKEIAPRLQPNGQIPLRAQVESQLAKIAREKVDRDERYAKAAKNNQKAPSPSPGEKPAGTPAHSREYLERVRRLTSQ